MEITRSQVVTIEDPRHHKWTVCASICPYTYPNLWVFVESFQLFPNRQALCAKRTQILSLDILRLTFQGETSSS